MVFPVFGLPHHRALLACVLALGASACVDQADVAGDTAYLGDSADRRALLEAALWRPELPYSAELLDSYGLGDSGWDLLPEQPSSSRPFTGEDAALLTAGKSLELGTLQLLVGDEPPSGDTDWQALGARVFAGLPMREDAYVNWLASNPERWRDLGITPTESGGVRGLVVYQRDSGGAAVGITCNFCHGGDDVPGRGDRSLDVGAIRYGHAATLGRDPVELLTWGPGRADVTDDGVTSITAIPDLYLLGDARYINHSGVIANTAPGTLAVRFETQYIKGHRMRTRPARDLMWGLERYLSELEPPEDLGPFASAPPDPALGAVGAQEFQARCASCHAPDRAYSGGLVKAELLDVDQSVAVTPERGTGFYKVPSLRGVRNNAPYLHDGSAASLEDLLRSGHPMGTSIPAATRDALVAFLHSL